MALSSMIGRASPAFVPLAIRAVGSSRVLDGVISAIDGGGLRRTMHSSPFAVVKTPVDGGLLRAVRDEISTAKKYDHKMKPEIPHTFPFSIEDNPYESSILLTRKFSDESIQIKVDMPQQIHGDDCYSSDDSDDDDDDDSGCEIDYSNDERKDEDSNGERKDDDEEKLKEAKFAMTMTVCKGIGLWLECKLTASGVHIDSIDHISLKEEKEDDPESHFEYQLPDSIERNDFSSGFNASFFNFLETRGITPNTASFLYKYMVMKKQRDRLPVLRKLRKFIKNRRP